MTARPSGAFCSPPSPSATAIGTIPRIIASAVISTGRKRVFPASIAASMTPMPCVTRASLAEFTSKMLFDVAMPTAMMAPMNDSTFSVVPVAASIHSTPMSAPGTATRMMNGSRNDWNRTTSSR